MRQQDEIEDGGKDDWKPSQNVRRLYADHHRRNCDEAAGGDGHQRGSGHFGEPESNGRNGKIEVEGDAVTVAGPRGSVTLPVAVTEGMVDGVVWLPTNSSGCHVRHGLGADNGHHVSVNRAATDPVTKGASA